MIKNTSSYIIGLLLLTVTSFAQPQTRSFEDAGSELIAKAGEHIRSLKSIRADFTYIMENEQYQAYDEMQGSLYSRDNSFRMILGNNVFVSDGVSVWIYMEEVNEIHISLAEDTEVGITPLAMLEDLEQNSRALFIRQERYEGKKADIVDLMPKDPQAFYKYRVALDANDHSLLYTIAYDRQGGTYSYYIKEIRDNTTMDPSLFHFDTKQYPGAEIIDLR